MLYANHPLAGWGLAFDITVLNVEDTDGKEAVGTDDTVVPSFLGFADKIIDEGDDEDDASEESPEPRDSALILRLCPRSGLRASIIHLN